MASKQRDVQWNDEAVAAFDGAKEVLSWATMLVHRDAPTTLTVDASDSAVGGALEQMFEGC